MNCAFVVCVLAVLIAAIVVRSMWAPVRLAPSHPRSIFVTYKRAEEVPTSVCRRLQELHPTYELHVYGDTQCAAFLRAHWSDEHARYFERIPAGPIRADFWRAAVLYTFGGVYVDIDVQLHQAATDFVAADAHLCVPGSMLRDHLNPIIIVARPKSPILRRCVEIMFEKRHVPFDYWTASICPAMHQSVREFVPHFPSDANQSCIYHTAHGGLKVQLLREEPWRDHTRARTTWRGQTICMNHNPALYDTATHRVRAH